MKPSPFNQLPASVLLGCGALSMSGMAMLMAGMVGMTQPNLVPMLAQPSLAWPLIAVGGILESSAMTMLLGALRQRRRDASHTH